MERLTRTGDAVYDMQHYEVLKELGDCCAAVGQADRAAACYREAQEVAPHSPHPYVGLGILALQRDDLDTAEEHFYAARRLDDRCSEAYGGLGMVYQQCREFEAAFDMYLKCLEFDADNLIALLGLFQTSCQMGSFAKIMHYLDVYLQRHPGDTSVLFCLATLQAREGLLDEAGRNLAAVLALEPDKREAVELLAEVERCLQREAISA